MEYAAVPGVREEVSRIVFGTHLRQIMRGEDCDALFDRILELGVNTFDTARVYGKSEETIGSWMERRGCRGKVVLLSKGGHPDPVLRRSRISEKAIRRDFGISAAKLRTDRIDIYLLHRDDPDTEVAVSVETMNALQAEGKIGASGVSNWTHRRIEEAAEYAYAHNLTPFSVSSPFFSLAEQKKDPWGGGCVSIAGPKEKEAQNWYRKNGMAVFSYSSLAGGLLSGRVKSAEREKTANLLDSPYVKGYCCEENFERLHRCEVLSGRKGCSVSQIALAYLFAQGINLFTIAATSSGERMKENCAALDLDLSEEECRWLNLEAEKDPG